MQFHTEVSYQAMMFTAEFPYARLRSAQTCAQEEIELEAFQREVYTSVPVPAGADDIPEYPARHDWVIPFVGSVTSPPAVGHAQSPACLPACLRGWLQQYRSELPEVYSDYIGSEEEARSISNYESLFIPGLLQTEGYATPLLRGTLPYANSEEIENRVVAR